jgi:hypothetical protein
LNGVLRHGASGDAGIVSVWVKRRAHVHCGEVDRGEGVEIFEALDPR